MIYDLLAKYMYFAVALFGVHDWLYDSKILQENKICTR